MDGITMTEQKTPRTADSKCAYHRFDDWLVERVNKAETDLAAALAAIKRLESDVDQREKYLADIKVRIESYDELLRRLSDSEAAIKRRDEVIAEVIAGKVPGCRCMCSVCSDARREWVAAKLKGDAT